MQAITPDPPRPPLRPGVLGLLWVPATHIWRIRIVIAGCASLVLFSTAQVVWRASPESLRRVQLGGSPLQPEDVSLLLVLLGTAVSLVLITVLLFHSEEIATRRAARARRRAEEASSPR